MKEWDIGFSEALPLKMMGISPETKIPGMIVFSPRALPLAGWLSGLELGYLKLQEGTRPIVRLETGANESWILANLTSPQTREEAERFENTKQQAQNIHFLAIQASPDSDSFAGFWLLKED